MSVAAMVATPGAQAFAQGAPQLLVS
jgi:hypothetical protein